MKYVNIFVAGPLLAFCLFQILRSASNGHKDKYWASTYVALGAMAAFMLLAELARWTPVVVAVLVALMVASLSISIRGIILMRKRNARLEEQLGMTDKKMK